MPNVIPSAARNLGFLSKSLFTISLEGGSTGLMKTVRAEGCAKPLSKHERLLANLQRFYTPFDMLRACPVLDTGANFASADEMIIDRL